MNRSERVTRASNLYEKLQDVERNLASIAKNPNSQQNVKDVAVTRAQMAALEHMISLLRLIQSESRLRQQLWIAIPSIACGSALTLLIQYLKI